MTYPSSSSSSVGSVHGAFAGPFHPDECSFIVNVSAMEGKFYRKKMPTHPHTSMAKAGLNMMTRTIADDYASDFIFVNCVDTGWINEENPIEKAARTAEAHGFATPLDEIDAAARILDPILAPLSLAETTSGDEEKRVCFPMYGAFLKDYYATEW